MGYGKGLGPLRPPQRDAGFTLVELLLALFLFAFIAGVIFAAFAAVASGVEKGRQHIELYHVGRVALLRMAQEIGAAMPPPAGSAVFFQGKKNADGGTGHDRIDFLTIPYRRYSDKVPSYELCHVAYYVADTPQEKPAVADPPQEKPALFREENCSGEEDERRELATRLQLTDLAVGLEMTYYDVDKDYEEWPPNRDEQSPLPCRVRLALTLRDAQQYERTFITTVALPMRGACENAQTSRTQTQTSRLPAPGR